MQERSTNDTSNANDLNHERHQLRSFVVGAAFGAGIALLLAPASGADTRKRIGGAARRIREEAGERIHDLREDAEEAVDKGREAYYQTRDARRGGSKAEPKESHAGA